MLDTATVIATQSEGFMGGSSLEITRREALLGGAAIVVGTSNTAEARPGRETGVAANGRYAVPLTVNGVKHSLSLDPRTTLLDALREHIRLTGTKKGCDQGQCGACTVLVNGHRINACLSLALQHAGDEVTTIEGLGQPGNLHPMQAAFVEHDGFQCGYCTPGQICSAVGTLAEIKAGIPSHVQADVAAMPTATPAELRERMSGNICRCAAYANITAAIEDVARSHA